MMLQTTSQITFTSPLSATLQGQHAQSPADVRESVGLADLSGQPIWHVRGKNAASTLEAVPSNVGEVITMQNGLIAQPRGDQYFLINIVPDAKRHSDGDAVLTVTDMTHGYGHLVMVGKRATYVLAKVCGLDFSDKAFPDHHVAQTSLAKVRSTIIRHDRDALPAYHILVGYPVTVYVWDVLFDAMQEFGGHYVQLD
jgi:sarcosine oxidase subunit gamma